MNKIKLFVTLFIILIKPISSFSNTSLSLKKFQTQPQLVITLVIDQFRADYLTRYQKDFLPAKTNVKLGGFQFLMSNSAYFPFAQYDVFQNMTCPGHAMISTGSRPYANGIVLNDFYDRTTKKMTYCADDDKDGLSPRKLKSTTVSDEYKNAGHISQVYSIALKDRSAIMLGGHRADLALWMNYENFNWDSSTYYSQELPKWLTDYNLSMKKRNIEISNKDKKYFVLSKRGLSLSHGINETFNVAEEILKQKKLGQQKNKTDFLSISLSSHDMMGHQLGLNSDEIKDLTLYEDKRISQFLNTLKSQLKTLDHVVIVLTADHGIAPSVEYTTQAKINSGRLDYLQLHKVINTHLDKKFGEYKNKSWIAATKSLHLYLDQNILNEKKIKIFEVENEIKNALINFKGISKVVTRTELINNQFPVGLIGDQLKKQFNENFSGDIIIIPEPFFYNKDDNLTTHMTGYSYDRTVPILFFGAKFKTAVYSSEALVIDIAPTLSFVLGIIPPALSEGKVLPVFE